jgi:hypothetical protein
MRLAMIIGVWCAAFCLFAHDRASAQCRSSTLDAFCDHAASNPFDAGLESESARHGNARPSVRRKIVRRSAPTIQAQAGEAAPKGASREALYAYCRNAVFRKFGTPGVVSGKAYSHVMLDTTYNTQVEGCVANGGKVI